MKTSILTLALALAFSLGATSAAALDDLAKCRVYNAKIKMNYAKCLELDKLLVEKGKAPKGICESKRTTSLDKATAKFVDKLGVSAEDCGIDSATTDEAQALQLLASSDDPLTTEQEAALAGTAADITSDNQTVCEDANGTWESGTCAPSYNCSVGALCSAWAAEYPDQLQYYTNNYIGHTAASSGCPVPAWEAMQPDFDFPLIEFLTPPCSM